MSNLWPAPLVLRIGSSAHWPDTLRTFTRGHHTHIVLDDVRDLAWVGQRQDQVQGVWDEELEFGTTEGGTRAYKKYVYQAPIVVTRTTSSGALLPSAPRSQRALGASAGSQNQECVQPVMNTMYSQVSESR